MSGLGDKKNGPNRPGMMGDETEEQNLGQPGDETARITEDEVDDAFDAEPDAPDDAETEDEDEGEEDGADRPSEFWKGFALGAVLALGVACLIHKSRPQHPWLS